MHILFASPAFKGISTFFGDPFSRVMHKREINTRRFPCVAFFEPYRNGVTKVRGLKTIHSLSQKHAYSLTVE